MSEHKIQIIPSGDPEADKAALKQIMDLLPGVCEAALRIANRRIIRRLRTFVRDYAEGDEELALLDGLDTLAELVEDSKVDWSKYDEDETE